MRAFLRKQNTTRITSSTEIIRVFSMSLTEARMVTVWSIATCTSIDCGMEAVICGRTARMRSTVSMMLAPGWRKMMTKTEGLPFA